MALEWHPDRVIEGIVRGAFLIFLLVASGLRVWLERRWLGRVARHIVRHLCSCLRKPMSGDLLEERVRQRRHERRLQHGRMFVMFVNIRFLVKEVSWLLGIFSGEPTLSVAELVLQHCGVANTLLMSLFPGIITFKTIHVLFSWNMCCDALAGLVSESVSPVEAITPAFFWCWFDLLPWLNALWLAVHMTACMSKLWPISQPGVYYEWCSTYINACLMLALVDYMITAGIRFELLAQDSGNELGAVKRLLGTICDVVVELDKSLCLAHHSPRLSDILIYSAGRSLQGMAIQEFMPSDDDRRDFVVRMHNGSDEASAHADVFHTKLRDSGGSNIAMEFFSVPFAGPDNRRRHLLGMREFTDIHPLTPSPQRLPSQPMPSPRPRGRADAAAATQTRQDACPAEVERDVRSLSASESSSQCSDGDGPKTETADAAKKLTIASTLMGWSLAESEGACCPWHLALAESRRVSDAMLTGRCQKDFGPVGKWWCRNCGIAAVEYRDRTLKHSCLLCKDVNVHSSQPKTRSAREMSSL